MILLEGVGREYDGRWAVRELSLEVARGELLMLVGGSGCGKTTTLKMINRLVEPSRGQVRIDGADVREGEPHELRRGIGYCFQEVGLFPHWDVERNVGVGLELAGVPPDRRRGRVRELLEIVDLPLETFGQRRPDALSGGQRQRVGIARALAARPEIVLLDEPFGALDPLTRQSMQDFFAELRRELGLTAVFVTHDMSEALLLGDRIAVMRDGELLQVGTPAELLAAPTDPYVAELLEGPRRQAARVEALLDGT